MGRSQLGAGETTVSVAAPDEVRATVEAWRQEARDLIGDAADPLFTEWLSGRIGALTDTLGLLIDHPS